MAPRPMKYRLAWPWNADQVEKLDTMLQDLFEDIRNGALVIVPDQFVGALPADKGGTGLSAFVIGDVLYANTTTTLARLGIGSANTIFWTAGTIPAWTGQPIIASGNRIVTLNETLTGSGGLVGISRPDDGAIRGYFGGSAAPNDDGVLYWSGGSSELRLVSGGGASAGFGFYLNTDSVSHAAGLASAFASARPTSNLVVKIDGNGHVGIGVVPTTGAIFQVKVDTDQHFIFRNDGAAHLQLVALNDAYSTYQTLKIDALPLLLNYASGGNVGIQINASPTAKLHIAAGSATASTAPLKFSTGTRLSSIEFGAMEFDSNLYFTNDYSIRFAIGGATFDHYADAGNSTTTETDLYSDTTAANTLRGNGDKLSAMYAGIFVSSATATRQLRVYFGGTAIFDSGALSISAGSDAWDLKVSIIRESATVVRCSTSMTTTGAALTAYVNYTRVTGLTLTSTNILKITGQAAGVGAATNDIVAKLGTVSFVPAA